MRTLEIDGTTNLMLTCKPDGKITICHFHWIGRTPAFKVGEEVFVKDRNRGNTPFTVEKVDRPHAPGDQSFIYCRITDSANLVSSVPNKVNSTTC
jgi:hypothetical protein